MLQIEILLERPRIGPKTRSRNNKKTRRLGRRAASTWSRGQDLNLRPSGYEPDELPDCSTPRYYVVYDMFSSSKIFPKKKMDGGGFEPPKQFAADLQSVPFGHSGIHPYGIVFHKADDRTRTDNLLITNQLLCQLSHIGVYSTADL